MTPSQKGLTPEDVLRQLAGDPPTWMHESKLPLWLVKAYEERLRRQTSEKEAYQAQLAHKSDSLDLYTLSSSLKMVQRISTARCLTTAHSDSFDPLRSATKTPFEIRAACSQI